MSSPGFITCGVPQGSILGPLLFLVYVNDMVSAVKCKLLLYADDSALLVSGKDITKIEKELGSELEAVSDWLSDNKLSLHLGKTESILFGSKRKINKAPKLNISCKGNVIQAQKSVKYLGSEIEQDLSGEAMGTKLIKIVHSRLKFVYRNSKSLTQSSKHLLASALILCHYDYACGSWYNSLTVFTRNRLQTAQNKLIRFVLGLPSRAHLGHKHFRDAGWLPVALRVRQLTLHHTFKILNGSAPSYLQHGFTKVCDVHSIRTRHSNNSLVVPGLGRHGQKSFLAVAIRAWNGLPFRIRGSQTFTVFKKSVRHHLFQSLREAEENSCIYY